MNRPALCAFMLPSWSRAKVGVMKHRLLTILAPLALATLAVFACDHQGSDDPATGAEQDLRSAKIDLARAIAVARDTVAGGQVVEAEFEQHQGEGVYEVVLLVGEEVVEVWIDPEDGKV
ncbi:MAG: PepSY domain-containing protein, partial [Myxococcales bacterium]|nr:PepSY domain-containing protein [Myxococcales bacterium]